MNVVESVLSVGIRIIEVVNLFRAPIDSDVELPNDRPGQVNVRLLPSGTPIFLPAI